MMKTSGKRKGIGNAVIIGASIGMIIGLILGGAAYLIFDDAIFWGFTMGIGNVLGMIVGAVVMLLKPRETE